MKAKFVVVAAVGAGASCCNGAWRFAASHSARLDRAAAAVHRGLHARVPPQLRERGERSSAAFAAYVSCPKSRLVSCFCFGCDVSTRGFVRGKSHEQCMRWIGSLGSLVEFVEWKFR